MATRRAFRLAFCMLLLMGGCGQPVARIGGLKNDSGRPGQGPKEPQKEPQTDSDASSAWLDLVPENVRNTQGGGFAAAGLVGEYFSNPALSGAPSFVRKDVRIDFDWGTLLRPGGSLSKAFAAVSHDNFSVRWTGRLVPRFSEEYTFRMPADDGVRLFLKSADGADWRTLIDAWTGTRSEAPFGKAALEAGKTYDVRVEYRQLTGHAGVRLLWESVSTPLEVIDPLIQTGINNPEWSSGFTNIVKGARSSWEKLGGGGQAPVDANGWPTVDAGYVFQESLNQGLDIDPLMQGRISFRFTGSAKVELFGNVDFGSLTFEYDPQTNTTSGSFKTKNAGGNASMINFRDSSRGAGAGAGIADLKLMRPSAPGADTSYPTDESVIFTPQLKKAMEHFTIVRHQYVANNQAEWAERTPPGFFNQNHGTRTKSRFKIGGEEPNGASWEYKIMFANETGRDLMLSIPTLASGRSAADVNSYLVKLARLLRYGSDGVEPYSEPVANPKFPPLNSNLRVYLEIENELWNWAGPFWFDWQHINLLTLEDVDGKSEDFKTLNFDNLPLTKNEKGEYHNLGTWRFRKIVLRTMQISDIFRSVFGDGAMHRRIRPVYEWQYDNANGTANAGLDWADLYFNNGDGNQHVTNPKPLSHWLWGGGGAAYYGATNGTGKTDILPDGSFETPQVNASLVQNQTGSAWTFEGTAGIANPSLGGGDLPPPHSQLGSQYAFIQDTGAMSVSVTFPETDKPETYALLFRAVNRGTDSENFRVFLDDKEDITARTASQGNGYTPAAYSSGNPWYAANVWWMSSEYYYTKTFVVQPGATHRFTFRGMGSLKEGHPAGQIACIDDVRVASLERIFADGLPGGGEATGQPAGQNFQRVLNVESSFAKAFNLEMLAYESGWSLGGDDGGSWLQNTAKHRDPRARAAQVRAMDMFHQSGGYANVFGTYAQWPSWSDYIAEQGLLDVSKYPIIQGVDDRSMRLPPEAVNGKPVPAAIDLTANRADSYAGGLRWNGGWDRSFLEGAGKWLAWNIIVPARAEYSIALKSSAVSGSRLEVLVDEVPVATGSSGGTLSGKVRLTKGLHVVRVRALAAPGRVQLEELSVAGP